MLRRHFLVSTLVLPIWGAPIAAPVDIVQLLLLRDSKEPVACGSMRYIKGNLYGVPSHLKLNDVSSAIGLTFLAHVEELPYELNVKDASCIPAGTYPASIRTDKKKPWMTTVNRTWRLELNGTKPRSAIQFHYGKDFHWSKGCVILTGTDDLVCKEGIDSPEEAVAALRNYVTTGHNSSTPIFVKIAFAG
jgi:hypothetical protein